MKNKTKFPNSDRLKEKKKKRKVLIFITEKSRSRSWLQEWLAPDSSCHHQNMASHLSILVSFQAPSCSHGWTFLMFLASSTMGRREGLFHVIQTKCPRLAQVKWSLKPERKWGQGQIHCLKPKTWLFCFPVTTCLTVICPSLFLIELSKDKIKTNLV